MNDETAKVPTGPVPTKTWLALGVGGAVVLVLVIGPLFFKASTAPHRNVLAEQSVRTPSPDEAASITSDVKQNELQHAATSPAGLAVAAAQPATPPPGAAVSEAQQGATDAAERRRQRLEETRLAPNLGIPPPQIMAGMQAQSPPAQSAESKADAFLQQAMAQLGQAGITADARPAGGQGGAPVVSSNTRKDDFTLEPGSLNEWGGKPFAVFKGTVIPCVLQNELQSDFTGPVMCSTVESLKSKDREHVLIPSGTLVFGEAQRADSLGQQRLAVFFDGLRMPDGFEVSLRKVVALDDKGAAGLHDKVDNHLRRTFGAAMALGILGGVAELGTGGALTAGGLDRMREGLGVGLANSGYEVLSRYTAVLPTIKIRPGFRVDVFMTEDLGLPAYEAHRMDAHL